MAVIEVKVPDIGDFKDVGIIEVMVKPGDTVKVEQSLITVESDKASMEIPSSHAGVVKEVKVKVGDKVSMGSPVVVLEGSGAAAAPAPALAPAATGYGDRGAPLDPATRPAIQPASMPTAEKPLPTAALPAHEPANVRTDLPHASPTIRKLAREL